MISKKQILLVTNTNNTRISADIIINVNITIIKVISKLVD